MKPCLTALAIRLFLSFVCLSPFISFSQTHTTRTVFINSNCGGYFEYLPVNYATSTKKFPVIVYIHGNGSTGSGSSADLQRVLSEGVPYMIKNNRFPNTFTVNGETNSFVVFSPQFKAWPKPPDIEAVLNYLFAQGYKIDPSRLYVTGYSLGGDATFKYPNTSLAASKRIAALAPSAAYNYPYVDTGAKYIAAANLPVWGFHGANDAQAPYTWTRNFINKINSFNPTVKSKYTIFPGLGHNDVWQKIYDPAWRDSSYNLYEWFLMNRRNLAPIAKAGNDVSLTLPSNSVQLNGSGSSDPENDPVTYQWKKISGPGLHNFNNSTAVNPIVSNLIAGDYRFELAVTDNNDYTGKDTVSVLVINPNPNQLPDAIAIDKEFNWPLSNFTLDGSASFDSDGAIETYQWSLLSAPPGTTLNNASNAIANVSNVKPGIYQFRLTVQDNENGSDFIEITITVNNLNPNVKPLANAGPDQTIYLPINTAQLNGQGNDTDGQITAYRWEQVSGPAFTISDPNISNPILSGLTEGVYKFEFIVWDDSSAVGKDTVNIIVSAVQRVLIDIGSVQTASPDQWGKYWNNMTDARPGIRVTNARSVSNQNTTVSLQVINRIDGTFSTGSNGTSSGNTIGIVSEYPANATNDFAISHESTTTGRWRIYGLNAASTYTIKFWGTRSGTATRIIQIKRSDETVWQEYNSANNKNFNTAASFNFTGKTEMSFDIRTKTGSTFGYINVVDITIYNGSATPPQNVLPLANAGSDASITLPANTVTLNGNGSSDPDGSILSYQWSKISGPTQGSITNASSAQTTVTNLVAGIYKFELLVTDNSNGVTKDTVQITVNPAPNLAPLANAGIDQTIQLPVNQITLSGTASDPENAVLVYGWSRIGGPDEGSITNPNNLQTIVTDLVAGIYKFELVVTDTGNLSAKDTIQITVIPVGNVSPVANAGTDASITLPVNNIQLNGTASSDEDGTISSYLWNKLSGPSQFNFDNASSPTPTVNNLVAGTYRFQLTVTDNDNAASSAIVTITVNPDPSVVIFQRVLIDIGADNNNYGRITTSPDQWGKYWNNMTDSRPGIRVSNAIDINNVNTGIGLEVINRIDGTFSPNGPGMNHDNNVGNIGDYPANAVYDNAIAHNSTTTGRWRLYGLDPARNYTVKFWGVRVTYGLRVVQIKKSTDATWTQEFDAVNNTDFNRACYLTFTGVTEMSFDIRVKPGQTYGNISVIDISSTTGAPITQFVQPQRLLNTQENKTGLTTFPNPASNQMTWQLTNTAKGRVKYTVIDMNGTVVKQLYRIKTQGTLTETISIADLPKGTYIMKVEIKNSVESLKFQKIE